MASELDWIQHLLNFLHVNCFHHGQVLMKTSNYLFWPWFTEMLILLFSKINKQNEWIRDKPAPVNKRRVWALKSEFEAAGVDGRHSKQHIRLEWHQCTAVRLPPWMSFVFTVMLHLFKWRLLAKLTVRTSTNVLSHRVALTLWAKFMLLASQTHALQQGRKGAALFVHAKLSGNPSNAGAPFQRRPSSW